MHSLVGRRQQEVLHLLIALLHLEVVGVAYTATVELRVLGQMAALVAAADQMAQVIQAVLLTVVQV
jgi:hypothetical protein